MTFLYVDRILEYQPGKLMRGLKNVTRSEPFLFPTADGRRRLSMPIVIEAAAQLGSWLAIVDSGFTKRPLFLGEDLAEFGEPAHAGDMLDLTVELLRIDDEVFETSALAKIGDRVVMKSHSSKGFLMPMEDFASPLEMEKRYKELFRPQFKAIKRVEGPVELLSSPHWHLSQKKAPMLLDGVIAHKPGASAECYKNISATESYFEEHFPRRSIVPGVVILTMVSDTCEYLIRDDTEALGQNRRLQLKRLINGRFRKMVEPGDQCIMKAKVKELDQARGRLLATIGVHANDTRVAQVDLEFQIMPVAAQQDGHDHAV